MKRVVRLARNVAFPLAAFAALLLVNALFDAETIKAWTPIVGLIFIFVVYAHFENRCDNISMDLESIEEALDRLDPDVNHRSYRFRFKRDWNDHSDA